jgi:hypothetical protein
MQVIFAWAIGSSSVGGLVVSAIQGIFSRI